MRYPRASGILLHPTSLPGPGGIGSLGPAAERLLEDLHRCGQGVWQILPLGPTGSGNSPYQSFSAFGGNPLLVSPEALAADGLIRAADVDGASFPDERVDFAAVIPFRDGLLGRAWDTFRNGRGPEGLGGRFQRFREREARWVEDLGLFLAIKDARRGAAWMDWPPELARREEGALAQQREELAAAIDRAVFEQFLFFEQWGRVRAKAKELGIEIFGDLPIFVAPDSSDVWTHQDLFDLDEAGRPRVVAGVPPDYFSATGQRWGNPLYRWDAHRERGYDWWIDRVRTSFSMYDRLRIDHFRGFVDYWTIPADDEIAVNGSWVPGPGAEFFEALGAAVGEMPIVAEDLGDITPAVHDLRDRLGFPGMRVLQFGFGPDPDDAHSPGSFPANCVAYTGTHDNDTVRGWFESGDHSTVDAAERDAQRERVLRHTGTEGSEIHWDLIRVALSSVADTAIVPMQDLLGLGSGARMNVPGRPDGNWEWRLRDGEFGADVIERLAELTRESGRWRGAE
jgi:4-alpha-glucanotransferase